MTIIERENDNSGWFIILIDFLPYIFRLLVVCTAAGHTGGGRFVTKVPTAM